MNCIQQISIRYFLIYASQIKVKILNCLTYLQQNTNGSCFHQEHTHYMFFQKASWEIYTLHLFGAQQNPQNLSLKLFYIFLLHKTMQNKRKIIGINYEVYFHLPQYLGPEIKSFFHTLKLLSFFSQQFSPLMFFSLP